MMGNSGPLLLCALLAAAVPARSAAEGSDEQLPEPPHILFIVLDAARTDRLSCCGYPKPTTPRLDELARRGAVFLNCFAPATRTDRAVSRILSSRHLSVSVVPGDGAAYGVKRETPKSLMRLRDAEQVFLPELLGQNGYRTAVFTDHPWISENARLAGMFHERFFRLKWREDDRFLPGLVSQWLREVRGKPAFAYIHLLCPHAPYLAGPEPERFLPGWTLDELARLRLKAERLRSTYAAGWSARDLEGLSGLYDANLRRADRQVGAILDRVRKDGREGRTLVIVTADHAENLGEHGQLQHGGPTWDTTTRVPLILALPGAVPAGLVVRDDVSSLDIVPTLAALSGAKVPPGKSFDGESLLPVLRGTRPARPFVLAEEYLREGGFKYIAKPEHLADVRRDPGETRDLSASEPALLARMRARHAELLEPHRRRAAEAVRAGAPAYPFYYPMQAFSISPAPAVAQPGPENPRPEAPPDAPWVLRYDWEDPILYRSAGGGPASVDLSAPLPEGDYRASALIECSDSRIAAAEAFEFRLSSSAAFRRCPVSELPRRTAPRSYGAGKNFVSCPLGPAAISAGVFRFEARAELPAADGCSLRHVLFHPSGGLPGRDGASDPARTRELLRRMRQAGYW
jgi:arylsulfatase A-like enzyme